MQIRLMRMFHVTYTIGRERTTTLSYSSPTRVSHYNNIRPCTADIKSSCCVINVTPGIPTSLVNTSQQWDYPNAWPSMQAFIIQGLEKTQQPIARQVALKITDVWLRFNYKLYLKEFNMYEKVSGPRTYDVVRVVETYLFFFFRNVSTFLSF